jgi:hypothetical protein
MSPLPTPNRRGKRVDQQPIVKVFEHPGPEGMKYAEQGWGATDHEAEAKVDHDGSLFSMA